MIAWPEKHNVIGVNVSAATYDTALEAVEKAARARISACVTHLAVHGLVEGSQDPDFAEQLAHFNIVAPDGQPVRMALNWLYNAGLPDRCYGPEFTLRVCKAAAEKGIGVYLYGSRPEVVDNMAASLTTRFPGLKIAGAEPSVFRPLTEEEDEALVSRINGSGAGVVFIGLGCPLQEKFAFAHLGRIMAVQICVGAAFDFHAGNKKMAPAWMQRLSLEWLYRLIQEPRRLWKRYLVTNTIFCAKLILQFVGIRKYVRADSFQNNKEN